MKPSIIGLRPHLRGQIRGKGAKQLRKVSEEVFSNSSDFLSDLIKYKEGRSLTHERRKILRLIFICFGLGGIITSPSSGIHLQGDKMTIS